MLEQGGPLIQNITSTLVERMPCEDSDPHIGQMVGASALMMFETFG